MAAIETQVQDRQSFDFSFTSSPTSDALSRVARKGSPALKGLTLAAPLLGVAGVQEAHAQFLTAPFPAIGTIVSTDFAGFSSDGFFFEGIAGFYLSGAGGIGAIIYSGLDPGSAYRYFGPVPYGVDFSEVANLTLTKGGKTATGSFSFEYDSAAGTVTVDLLSWSVSSLMQLDLQSIASTSESQTGGQQNINNTALNALHNQRIVRARSAMANPRTWQRKLASNDRNLGRYLRFTADNGLTVKQALGLEDVPASENLSLNDAFPALSNAFSIEQFAGCEVCNEPKRWEVFAVGDFGRVEQAALDLNSRGFQSSTWAGSIGAEYLVSRCLNVGAAYTYADNNTDLNEGLGGVDIEGHLYSVYATGFWDGKYVDVLYSYGDFDNEITRRANGTDLAVGRPGSDSHTFSINAGQNFEICGLVTGPTLGYDYTEGQFDAYREVGTGALDFQSRDYESSIGSVGWHVSKNVCLSKGKLMLQGFTSWEHEFEPDGGTIRATQAGLPGTLVVNQPGSAPGTDWMVIGVGARYATYSGWALDVDYQTQLFRDDIEAHYLGAKISTEF